MPHCGSSRSTAANSRIRGFTGCPFSKRRRKMQICDLPDPAEKALFEKIAALPEEILEKRGVNGVIRQQVIDGIIVPDGEESVDACWTWSGGHSGRKTKGRPVIFDHGKPFSVYRVLIALVREKHVQLRSENGLGWVLHKCPGHENPTRPVARHIRASPHRFSTP
jgi:hypothetical protein